MEESAKIRFLAYLKEKGIGQTKCEEMCGISRGYLSKIKDNFGTDMLNKISTAFPLLNIKWIISGIGEMEYKEDDKNDSSKEGSHSNLSNEHAFITRLLPLSAMGGSMSGFAVDGVMLQDCELIVSPVKNVDFAITVYGESMSPEYPSGSRVLIKKINPDIFIDWGRTYVLDTANGVVVKEVHVSDKEGHISCHSINPDPKFKPFDVPLNEVYGMYRVLMCLSAK